MSASPASSGHGGARLPTPGTLPLPSISTTKGQAHSLPVPSYSPAVSPQRRLLQQEERRSSSPAARGMSPRQKQLIDEQQQRQRELTEPGAQRLPSRPPAAPKQHSRRKSSSKKKNDQAAMEHVSSAGVGAALKAQNLNKFFEMAMTFGEEARNSSGSYVTSFPFEAAKHGVGLYGLQFQSALESAPKEMRTTTGFRPSMDDNVEVDDTSDSDDEGVMPFTRRRKKLIRKMKAKNRWKKASNQRQWDAHLQLKKHKSGGADMFAQLARKKMEEALEEKRRKLAAQLKAQMEEKKRLLRLAQTGRENATIAARKVLAQLYRLGGVDVRAAFRDFDRDNSELLEMDEFIGILRTQAKISKAQLSDEQLQCVFHAVDTDQSGSVDIEEFTAWVNREMEAASSPEKEKALREKMKAEMDAELKLLAEKLEQQARADQLRQLEQHRKEQGKLVGTGCMLWPTVV
eukprot:INCI4109.2.p1 GENE.INCI4109.2~~INCI4109.2.p1  ORF type:complete len:459 (+),score=117.26 INCI4109.2:160-1536(+)